MPRACMRPFSCFAMVRVTGPEYTLETLGREEGAEGRSGIGQKEECVELGKRDTGQAGAPDSSGLRDPWGLSVQKSMILGVQSLTEL